MSTYASRAAGVLTLALGLWAGATHAGPILGGVVSSPTGLFASGCQSPANAGNQVGLLGLPYTSGVTDFATHVAVTAHSGPACTSGFANSGSGGFAVFTMDMLSNVTVSDLAFWTADVPFLPPFARFDFYADSDNDYFAGGPPVPLLTNAIAFSSSLASVFPFVPTTSRYFHVVAQAFAVPIVAVGELALHGVPEPGSLALAGLALAGLGAARRLGAASRSAPLMGVSPFAGSLMLGMEAAPFSGTSSRAVQVIDGSAFAGGGAAVSFDTHSPSFASGCPE